MLGSVWWGEEVCVGMGGSDVVMDAGVGVSSGLTGVY